MLRFFQRVFDAFELAQFQLNFLGDQRYRLARITHLDVQLPVPDASEIDFREHFLARTNVVPDVPLKFGDVRRTGIVF